jgi:hypothetical protein
MANMINAPDTKRMHPAATPAAAAHLCRDRARAGDLQHNVATVAVVILVSGDATVTLRLFRTVGG